MKVGLVCGSLGERSANAALLRVAGARVAETGHEPVTIDGIAAMPAFDPGLVDDAPGAVEAFRAQVRDCDLLLIAAPEYAAGVAGSMKNALDWLVGDSTIYRKVTGVASAGTTGGLHAIEQLVRTISWQGGWVVATLGVAAPRTKSDETGAFIDEATLCEITGWADAALQAADGSPLHCRQLLSAVVTPYGIDPNRFGDL